MRPKGQPLSRAHDPTGVALELHTRSIRVRPWGRAYASPMVASSGCAHAIIILKLITRLITMISISNVIIDLLANFNDFQIILNQGFDLLMMISDG